MIRELLVLVPFNHTHTHTPTTLSYVSSSFLLYHILVWPRLSWAFPILSESEFLYSFFVFVSVLLYVVLKRSFSSLFFLCFSAFFFYFALPRVQIAFSSPFANATKHRNTKTAVTNHLAAATARFGAEQESGWGG